MTAAVGPVSIADLVNAGRRGRGWSRSRLSLESGLSQSTVLNVCSGATRSPHPDTVASLERALDWPVGYLEAVLPAQRVGGRPPGPRRHVLEPHRLERSPAPQRRGGPTSTPLVSVAAGPAREVMRLDVPMVPNAAAAPLTLPDPALRWRSPRNMAGRTEQVERWTYALAVARIIVKEAEASS